MAVKIRLTRMGSRHRPFYRLVVAESKGRRDGRAVDVLGYYNPLPDPAEIHVDREEALAWLQKGAQPSDTARSLLKQTGVWQRFQLLKQGRTREEADAEVAGILAKREGNGRSKAAPTTTPPPAPETSVTEETATEEPATEA